MQNLVPNLSTDRFDEGTASYENDIYVEIPQDDVKSAIGNERRRALAIQVAGEHVKSVLEKSEAEQQPLARESGAAADHETSGVFTVDRIAKTSSILALVREEELKSAI